MATDKSQEYQLIPFGLYSELIKAKQTLEEHQVEHGKQANN